VRAAHAVLADKERVRDERQVVDAVALELQQTQALVAQLAALLTSSARRRSSRRRMGGGGRGGCSRS
jgi:hypothetical protein